MFQAYEVKLPDICGANDSDWLAWGFNSIKARMKLQFVCWYDISEGTEDASSPHVGWRLFFVFACLTEANTNNEKKEFKKMERESGVEGFRLNM